MMKSVDLKDLDSHFEFGANWQDFASGVDETAIIEAERGLTRLVPAAQISGARFLDIGCGSGLHTLAALRQGATEVVAMDIDPDSVNTCRMMLKNFWPEANATVTNLSIFDADPNELGMFEIVYSWGVLHHTGEMWAAIDQAIKFVKDNGLFVVALYQKRATCGLWAWEKRIYTNARPFTRRLIRDFYVGAYFLRLAATGTNPFRHIKNYKNRRGMNFYNDAHDWLGGYPYESATPNEVRDQLAERGFELVHENTLKPGLGILGTGCAEYVFRRIP